MTLAELKATRAGVWGSMQDTVKRAQADGRAPTSDERAAYDKGETKLAELDAQIDLVQRDSDVAARIHDAGQGVDSRRTHGLQIADLSESRVADIGQYFRSLVTGESRAQSEGVSSEGGFAVPTPMASDIIDLARNVMVARQAGVRVLTLESQTHRLPKLESDATPTWRAEHALIGEDEITIGSTVFRARTAAVIVRASRELMEDSAMFGDILLTSLQASAAQELDRVVFAGSGVGEEPAGILNTAGVTVVDHLAAGLNYDVLADEVAAVRGANYSPTAQVISTDNQRAIGGLKGTDGHYITPPAYLDVPRLATNQAGDSVFTGDFSNVILGLRGTVSILPLKERYAEFGDVGFVLWFRGDVAVVRPQAVRVLTNVGG